MTPKLTPVKRLIWRMLAPKSFNCLMTSHRAWHGSAQRNRPYCARIVSLTISSTQFQLVSGTNQHRLWYQGRKSFVGRYLYWVLCKKCILLFSSSSPSFKALLIWRAITDWSFWNNSAIWACVNLFRKSVNDSSKTSQPFQYIEQCTSAPVHRFDFRFSRSRLTIFLFIYILIILYIL